VRGGKLSVRRRVAADSVEAGVKPVFPRLQRRAGAHLVVSRGGGSSVGPVIAPVYSTTLLTSHSYPFGLSAHRILILIDCRSAVSLKDQSAKDDFIPVGYTRQRKLSRHQLSGDEGIDFVRCHICGDHRRVIGGRHLSKHDTDRETYMQEYDLSPDELIAKAFRILQSSHPGYYPHNKKGWIVTMQKVYENDGKVFAQYLQHYYPQLYSQGVWIFGDWDKALRAAGFDPDRMRMNQFWDRQKIIKKLQNMRDRNLPLYARYMLKNHTALFSSCAERKLLNVPIPKHMAKSLLL
jgi:hypothetical protein